MPRSLATTRCTLALLAQRSPALAQRRRWPLPTVATRGLSTKGRHEPYLGQMHETTPGMERSIDIDAAAEGYAAGNQAQTELHGGRSARERLVAYAEMRTLIEIETAHDIEEMQKELRFLAGTYKLASERLEEAGSSRYTHASTGPLHSSHHTHTHTHTHTHNQHAEREREREREREIWRSIVTRPLCAISCRRPECAGSPR